MDATELAQPDKAAARPRPRDERARAAAYLDLWERQVGQAALHGLATAPAPAGSGA